MITTFVKLSEGGASPSDPLMVHRCTFVGDNSYPTGGYPGFKAFVQAAVERGLSPIDVRGRGVVGAGPTAYYLEYDNANDKLMVLVATTGLEAANATDLSTATFRATVISK